MDGFRAQGLESLVPRMRGLLRGAIHGFYEDEFGDGRSVVDKSRDWIRNIELMEEVLEKPFRIILCIRDVRDAVASLEKLFRENCITRPSRNVEQQLTGQTIMDRCKQYLANDAMLGMTINAIKDCFEKGLNDRLLIVPYHCLVDDPVGTVNKIHEDFGLGSFFCDPSNLKNASKEDDQVHGRKFHELRPQIDHSAVGRWRQYLTVEVAEWLNSEYDSIQNLAHGDHVCGWSK